jgi:uncharacterized protein YbjT (DUF2867 family)
MLDEHTTTHTPRRIALTGATGYIGGRLTPRLLAAGHDVTCVVRDPRKLDQRPWSTHPNVTITQADVANTEQLASVLRGHHAAYYLIHSMAKPKDGQSYASEDKQLARSFTRAASEAEIDRIIYLGGLGELGSGLSEHLRSRREVEQVLRMGPVPLTSFRAAMIIGSGSASFEILRYLVERLPVMVTPRWVQTECQPVAIADVLHWLTRCLDVPETRDKTLEIGGPDVLTYLELMRIMAEELELPKRIVIPVPVLTPKLSGKWIGLVTPVNGRIGNALAEGLRNRVVVSDDTTRRLMPHDAAGARTAIERALNNTRTDNIETRWSAAGVMPGDPDWAGGRVFNDRRAITIDATPAQVFAAVCRVGGGHGWYAADYLWRIRGWMDQLIGGPGLRRGRRHPERVEYGEALDFWRVVDVRQDRRLALRAEMKVPGIALLEFDLEPVEETSARTKLTMNARFRPKGLLGLAYWYAVLPLHGIVFTGMLSGMRRAAEAIATGESEQPTHERAPQPTP